MTERASGPPPHAGENIPCVGSRHTPHSNHVGRVLGRVRRRLSLVDLSTVSWSISAQSAGRSQPSQLKIKMSGVRGPAQPEPPSPIPQPPRVPHVVVTPPVVEPGDQKGGRTAAGRRGGRARGVDGHRAPCVRLADVQLLTVQRDNLNPDPPPRPLRRSLHQLRGRCSQRAAAPSERAQLPASPKSRGRAATKRRQRRFHRAGQTAHVRLRALPHRFAGLALRLFTNASGG
eukprot:gene7646-biopygen4569